MTTLALVSPADNNRLSPLSCLAAAQSGDPKVILSRENNKRSLVGCSALSFSRSLLLSFSHPLEWAIVWKRNWPFLCINCNYKWPPLAENKSPTWRDTSPKQRSPTHNRADSHSQLVSQSSEKLARIASAIGREPRTIGIEDTHENRTQEASELAHIRLTPTRGRITSGRMQVCKSHHQQLPLT